MAEEIEKKVKLSLEDSVSLFLILELIALVSFGLGNVNSIFHYIGFVVSVLALMVSYNRFKKEEWKSIAILLIPVILLSGLVAFGQLYSNNQNLLSNIGVFLAIPSFFMIGIATRRLQKFDVNLVLVCIGVGISLIVLVGIISTWIQYGFFHLVRYQDTPVYYYDGGLYNISNEMAWLVGFKFSEVSTQFGAFFSILLCCAFPSLLFISPKKDKKLFIITTLLGSIGLISLIFTGNFKALLFLVPIVLIACCFYFNNKYEWFGKVLKRIILVIVCIVALFIIFALLNALVPSINNFTKSNGFLNRLMNTNWLMNGFNLVIGSAFKSYNLFGFPFSSSQDSVGLNRIIIETNTHVFELEIIKEGGIFAFFALAFIVIFILLSIPKYFKKSKDSLFSKSIIITSVIMFLLYWSFRFDNQPYTHTPLTGSDGYAGYYSVSRSIPFLLLLFLLGLVFYIGDFDDSMIKIESSNKASNNNKNEIDTDYIFTEKKEKE